MNGFGGMEHGFASLLDGREAIVGVAVVEDEAHEVEEIGRVDAFAAGVPGCKAMADMRPNAEEYVSQVLHGLVSERKDTNFF